MYLYNITFAADKAVEQELIRWLSGEFIPESTDGSDALMYSPALLRVMGCGEPGTVSLAVHLYAATTDDIALWYADHGSRLFSDALDRWGEQVVFFPTTLEVIG